MKNRILMASGLTILCLAAGTVIAAFAPDPHEQIVAGIKVAADACHAAAPKNDYERKVCALVAP